MAPVGNKFLARSYTASLRLSDREVLELLRRPNRRLTLLANCLGQNFYLPASSFRLYLSRYFEEGTKQTAYQRLSGDWWTAMFVALGWCFISIEADDVLSSVYVLSSVSGRVQLVAKFYVQLVTEVGTFCEYIVNPWICDIASAWLEFYWYDYVVIIFVESLVQI